MTSEITLDQETFKALAGEKRIHILKELGNRRKTQAELAQKLGLSPPTIAEHIHMLKTAGLVEIQDEGHKWKYYALTKKGQKLVHPDETKIMVLLGTSAIAFIGTATLLANRYLQTPLNTDTLSMASKAAIQTPPTTPNIAAGIQNTAQPIADEAIRQAQTETTNQTITQLTPLIQLPELFFLILVSLVFGLMIGYYLHYKNPV